MRDPLPSEDREHSSALGGDTPAERRIKNLLDAAVAEEAPPSRRHRYRETSPAPGGAAPGPGQVGPESDARESGAGVAAPGRLPDGVSDNGGERDGMRRSTSQRGRSGRHLAPEETRSAKQAKADTELPKQPDPLDDDLPLAREAQRAVRVLNPSGAVTMPRPPRRRVIAIANQKGGVGKTTSTVNLAVALALHGNRVMVIDLDPQGNASTGLGVEHGAGTPSVYEAVVEGMSLDEIATPVDGIPSLYCIPATIDLAGAEVELVNVVAREARLQKSIETFSGELDYILIDCPPSLGLLTVNALVAAEEVLIPIQCEYYALEGLGQLLRNIELIKAHLNARLRVSTILLTMYDKRTKLADQVEQEVRGHFSEIVLDAVVPRSVRVSEAPGYGQSIMTYDPGSRGATSYFEAAEEIARRGAKLSPRRGGKNQKGGN